MMRTLLPLRRFSVETRLTPTEVAARLRDAVEAPRMFAFSRPERPFVGRVDGPAFDVMKTVAGRDSFRPRVRGTIAAGPSGTRLTGTMQLHGVAVAFLGVFLVMAVSAFFVMAAGDLRRRDFTPITLIPLGVIVLLGVTALVSFIPGTRRALEELVRIVDAPRGELD